MEQQPPQPQMGTYLQGTPAPTQDDKTMAMLGHILGIFFPVIVPLVIMLTKGKDSAWLRTQSVEALNFQITVFIAYAVAGVLSAVCIGLLLFPIVGLAAIVLGIMAGLKNNNGETYRYPATIRLVK